MRWFDDAGRRKAEIPALTRGTERARVAFETYRSARESIEHRSMLRGLIVIASAVLAGSIARAGLDRVFVHGWWRP